MVSFRLGFVASLLCRSWAAHSKNVLQISPEASFEHITMNLQEVQSLLADAGDQPLPSYATPVMAPPVMGPPVMRPPMMAPPVMGLPVMAPPVMAPPVQAGAGAGSKFDMESYQMGLPLDAGLRLQSDDGVWFSSRSSKSRADKDYDTNTLLGLPLKLYDKIMNQMGGG